MKKVILGFSGGLDTSFCVVYLREKGYEVVTVTVDTGGFSQDELVTAEKKSYKLGASKHYSVDSKNEFYNKAVSYLIKANGIYEDQYPNMCIDRYIIAEKLIETAKKENASIISHGSTGQGNDQVRFDSSIYSLSPEIEIIAPIRELGIKRKEEISYLENKGHQIEQQYKKYTINQNIFGFTISGSEIDDYKEPGADSIILTKKTKHDPEYFLIGFEKGLPISLNGEEKTGPEIIQILNKEVGGHGFGRKIALNNTIIGIKGRIVFESPGILTIISAHKALEKAVLTKEQYDFKEIAGQKWSNLVYSGKYHDPLVTDLNDFLDSTQKNVTGSVKMKVYEGDCLAVELSSDYILDAKEIATYAQNASWSKEDAEGFVKLWSLQQKIYTIKGV